MVDLVRKNEGKTKIDVSTTDVGKNKTWTFPYFGYGFARAKRMQGTFDNILVDSLIAEVGMERKWVFPYRGYGYAWIQEMSGECGKLLRLHLLITEVRREKKWEFPYRGYRFAGADKGVLPVTLKE